jgi:hypothetical protein
VNREIDINSIARIKFLMEYDVRNSPHENILLEQTTDLQSLAIKKGFGPVSTEKASELNNQGKLEPSLGKITNTQRDRYNAQIGPLSDRYNSIYDVPSEPTEGGNLWENWDHETAGIVEISMTLIGMGLIASVYFAPVGVAMVGGATAVGVADALKYYEEDSPYMGTFMMVLQIIPGGDFISGATKYLSKWFGKYAPDFFGILKKVVDNKFLTDFEKLVYDNLVKYFNKFFPSFAPTLRQYSFLFLRTVLKQLPLLNVMKLFRVVFKANRFLGKLVFKLGRIAITFDQLWILLSTPELRKHRDESSFGLFLDLIYDLGYEYTPEEVRNMFEAMKILFNPDGTDNVEAQENLKDQLIETADENVEQMDSTARQATISLGLPPMPDDTGVTPKPKPTPTPITIDSILKGEHTVRKGNQGQVVGEIQKMLLFLDYDLGDTGKKGAGIDRDFGDTTKKAVEKFQKDNNLTDTSGVVGKETLTLLVKQFKDATGKK